jgi:hypothetical protein
MSDETLIYLLVQEIDRIDDYDATADRTVLAAFETEDDAAAWLGPEILGGRLVAGGRFYMEECPYRAAPEIDQPDVNPAGAEPVTLAELNRGDVDATPDPMERAEEMRIELANAMGIVPMSADAVWENMLELVRGAFAPVAEHEPDGIDRLQDECERLAAIETDTEWHNLDGRVQERILKVARANLGTSTAERLAAERKANGDSNRKRFRS